MRHLGQNFRSSRRWASLRLFLLVGYVRSLQSVQPKVMSMRLSPLRGMFLTCGLGPDLEAR